VNSIKNCTIRQKIAVVAAMIHSILFSLYGNCRDKIRALVLPSSTPEGSDVLPSSTQEDNEKGW
jgi:hypothetical protein